MSRFALPALRAVRSARIALPTPRLTRSTLPLTLSKSIQSQPFQLQFQSRNYSSGGGLSREDITARVMEIMSEFEKVDGGKLTPEATFTSDLGLDSLDSVEVVMAIEEEFSIEIPDAEADEITTVKQAIDYVAKTPEAQ